MLKIIKNKKSPHLHWENLKLFFWLVSFQSTRTNPCSSNLYIERCCKKQAFQKIFFLRGPSDPELVTVERNKSAWEEDKLSDL